MLLFVFPTKGQQLYYKTYSLEQGLPQSEVWFNSFVKDEKGHLWAGTNGGGVVKFSGEQMQTFTTKDGLIGNQTRSMDIGPSGNVWVLSTNGVSKFDGFGIKTYLDSAGRLSTLTNLGAIPQILEDNYQNVWIKTFTALFVLTPDDSIFRNYLIRQPELAGTGIGYPSIIRDENGSCLLSTNQPNGAWKFNGNKFERINWNQNESSEGKAILLINSITNNNYLALLTQAGSAPEFAIYENGKWKVQQLPADFPTTGITKAIKDSKGSIWISSVNSGLLNFSKSGKINRYNTANGLPVNIASSVLEDNEGNIWASTQGSGLIKIPREGFVNFSKKDGLPDNLIFNLYEDSKKNIWMGTPNDGFCKWDGEKVVNFPNIPTKVIGRVDCFLEREDGSMFICGRAGGVFHFDGKNIKNVNTYFGLPPAAGATFIHETEKNFFIGGFGFGVIVWDKTTKKPVKTFTLNNGLDSNLPNAHMEDKNGNIWFACIGGLSMFDGESCRTYKHNGAPLGIALQMANTPKGNVWGVEYNKGLFKVQGDSVIFMDLTDYTDNLYYSVTADLDGNLWLGTQKGVLKVMLNPDESQIDNILSFGFSDGLSGIEMNGKAAFTDSEGNIWFGHLNGASRYTITEKTKNEIPPTTEISALELFFKKVDWEEEAFRGFHEGMEAWTGLPQNLELPYDQNHLTFHFATLSYTLPERTQRQWMLENADEDWLPVTNKQEATYSNIQPGTYTFKVKSINSDGVWGEPTVFKFNITPPFWQTPLFQAGTILLIGGLIFGGVRLRIQALKAKKEELERLVKERTSELRKTNQQVTLKNTELEQQKEEILAQAEEIEVQNRALASANEEITEQHRNITSSITYARRIQDAMLPSDASIKQALPESFVLYKPRDVVSGDFYWFEQQPDSKGNIQTMIAAADCTGHGVPGAFMSMAGDAYLNLAVRNKQLLSPSQILQELDRNISSGLKHGISESRDGMDIALCLINHEQNTVEFAGAKNPLIYIKNDELVQIKGSKAPIGGHQNGFVKQFQQHQVKIDAPTSFYIFSDGYPDQFGGEHNRKFMIKNFRELLKEIHQLPMEKQGKILEDKLDEWMQGYRQIDDILVIGFRLGE